MSQNHTTYLELPTPDSLADILRGWKTPDGGARGMIALVCDTAEDRAAVATLQAAARARHVRRQREVPVGAVPVRR